MTDTTQAPQPTVVPMFDKKDVEDHKLIAVLSYISILCLVPLLTKKESKFCQEHGKQGFVLFLFGVAVYVLGMVPVIGWFLIAPIGSILMLILAIVGIIKVLQGEFWEFPVIGKYRKNVNF